MHMKKMGAVAVIVAVTGVWFAATASASHSWGGYHWGRTANPFTLNAGDNVSAAWDAYLNEAATDWSASSVLDVAVVRGSTKPRACKPKEGRMEMCSERYGNTGWLGIAQIWISGPHITKAVAKMNDTYFSTPSYNTPAWRRMVMCQEVAHGLGLDHQDENSSNPNLGTCMDYTNDPDGGEGGAISTDPSNEHPNAHDYEQLESIYAHLDSVTTVVSAAARNMMRRALPEIADNHGPEIADLNDPNEWGEAVQHDRRGRSSLHARSLGKGETLYTFVTWTQEK